MDLYAPMVGAQKTNTRLWEGKVNWMSQIAKRRGGVAEITSCVFAMAVYMLWTAENYIRFQKRSFSFEQIIKDIVLHTYMLEEETIQHGRNAYRCCQAPF